MSATVSREPYWRWPSSRDEASRWTAVVKLAFLAHALAPGILGYSCGYVWANPGAPDLRDALIAIPAFAAVTGLSQGLGLRALRRMTDPLRRSALATAQGLGLAMAPGLALLTRFVLLAG